MDIKRIQRSTNNPVVLDNLPDSSMQEQSDQKNGGMSKRNSILFALALIFVLAGSTAVIAWVEFRGGGENMFEKNLASGAIGNLQAPASSANSPGVNSSTSKQMIQTPSPNTQNIPAETTPALGASDTSPQTNSDNITAKTQPGIFKDDKLGISLSYPQEYKIEEKNGQVIVSKSGLMWKLKIYDNKDKSELKTWFDGYYASGNNIDCEVNDSSVLKIGSLVTKLIKVSTTGSKCSDSGYYALNSDNSKAIRVILEKGTEDEANKVSSTFKFL